MFITMAGLKHSLGKYLVVSATENIFIIKNSKIVAKLTNLYINKVQTAKYLFGIHPKDTDIEETKNKIQILKYHFIVKQYFLSNIILLEHIFFLQL